jgi:hypothetical protein
MDGEGCADSASDSTSRPVVSEPEVRARFRLHTAAVRRRAMLSIPMIGLLLAVDWWGFGPVGGMVITGAAGVTLLVMLFAVVWPRRRAALRASAVSGDLLGFYRKDLDRKISALRKGRSLFPVAAILGGVAMLLGIWSIIADHVADRDLAHARTQIAMVVSMGVCLLPQWHRIRVDLPRLERERQELG